MRRRSVTRGRRITIAAVLACIGALAVGVGTALADAGNPINGTINVASAKDNGDGTVTIAVRGQWNWQSHGSDCNFDRAATGAAISWGDKNGRFVGTNEVQRITLSGTTAGASYTLKFKNPAGTTGTSGTILSTFTAAQMDAALESMSPQTIPAGGVSVTGGFGSATPLQWTITFTGALAETNVNALATGTKSGGLTVTIATLTAGVQGDAFNGYVLTNGATTLYLGTKTATTPAAGRTNPQDRMVHPTDIGNKAASPALGGAAQQVYSDPVSNDPNSFATWKGGCGREPMNTAQVAVTSASKAGGIVTMTTATPFNITNGDSSVQVFSMFNAGYNSPAAAVDTNYVTAFNVNTLTRTFSYNTGNSTGNGTSCSSAATCLGKVNQEPWGSWGYQTAADATTTQFNSKAFSHTYLKTLPDGSSGLPTQICVNFYDVHGGGTVPPSLQAVKSASEITVDGNGDNSVDTNDFHFENGLNCITVNTTTITTQASNAEVGQNIHDDATIGGAGLTTGTIHFEAFGPFPVGTDPAGKCVLANRVFQSDVATNGTAGNPYGSGNYLTAGAGIYFWTAHYTDDNPLLLQADSACGAQNETSTVAKKSPTLTTDAGSNPILSTQNPSADLRDTATLSGAFNPTGSITYTLYKGADCSAGNLVATLSIDGAYGPPNPADGLVHQNGSYVSQKHTTSTAGTYRWIANYSGDTNNNPTTNTCNGANETIRVFKPSINIDKSTTSVNVHDNDSVTYHIVVSNNGPDALENVAVTDSLYSQCDRTIAQLLTLISGQGNHDALLDSGESISYDCTVSISHGSEDANKNVTNTATVTGNALGDGSVSDTDDATVHVIHPSIAVTKSVCVTQAAPAFPRTVPVCAGPNDPALVVHVGDQLTYHIKVKNTGDSNLTDVVITDATLPACNSEPNHHVGTLTPNQEFEYDCTPFIVTSQTGDITNTAHAEGDDTADTPQSHEDTNDVDIDAIHPSIKITKTACRTGGTNPNPSNPPVCAPDGQTLTVHAGDQVTYHFLVENTGDVTLTNVAFSDPTYPSCDTTIGTLAAHASQEVTCNITIGSTDVTNTATATGKDPVNGTVSDDDDAVVDVIHPSIQITKTACRTGGTNPAPTNPPTCAPDGQTLTVHAGDQVTYHFLVENTGDVTLTNVTVSDNTFPADCNKTIGTLAAHASQEVTCSITIGTDDVTNTATATGTDPIGGTTSDTDDAVTDVIHPDITVTKDLAPGQTDKPTVGDPVTFRITVTNTGDVPLDNIKVTDAQAPSCGRDPLGTNADGTGPAITLAANGGFKTYDCTLASVPIDFSTNLAEACADDPLDGRYCDTDTETIEPQKAKPTVDTQASPTIVVGNGHTISDTATLSGGYNPTGTITFELYGPGADCSGPNLYTGAPVPVNGNGNYFSDAFTPTLAGLYHWIANYSGDLNNEATHNGCNGANENVTVLPNTSSITTSQNLLPNDTATVTGASVHPTGTLTFELFDNANCTGTALYTQDDLLSQVGNTLSSTAHTTNGINPNGNFIATGDGTWWWKVTYPGDANNKPVTSCVEKFSIDNDGTVSSP